MRILDIALKDLLQVIRDRMSAVFLLAMPIVFTLFFGFVLADPGGDADPRIPVGVVNQDGSGLVAEAFQTVLGTSEVVRLVPLEGTLEGVDSGAVDAQMADQGLSGVVIIPAGYSQAWYEGQQPGVEAVLDSSSMDGTSVQNEVQTAVFRIMGAIETAQISTGLVESRLPSSDEAQKRLAWEDAFGEAVAGWSAPPFQVQSQALVADGSDEEQQAPTGFLQSSPGIMVQFAVFGLLLPGTVLVNERQKRVLHRMLTTPVNRATVLAGHWLGFFLVSFLQMLILVLLGHFGFGVGYLREPAATLLMVVAVALMSSGLGLVLGVTAKKEEQVIMYALIGMFVLSAMGGAWFPLEITGETFSTIGHFLPSAWAMDGFQNIVLRGQGLAGVLLPVGILLAYTAVFFALAVWFFRRDLRS
jgi:ABC-2 type transport system permease protein